MTLGLRQRILLTLVPLLLLLAVVGTAGALLLLHLGNSVNNILRENYDSVVAMQRLNEALERIDSSFQFALSGGLEKAVEQYRSNWPLYYDALTLEQHNVTLPGEQALVDSLTRLTAEYSRQGDAFYAPQKSAQSRKDLYYKEPSGLLSTFVRIKRVSGDILHANQENMKQASRDSRRLAVQSLAWFGVGLAVALILAGFSAWRTVRTILRPIQSLTEAAIGISRGNLDQLVPHLSRDELGQLAHAFNTMARHLREHLESQSAQLLRAQQTSQATVDSFPDPVIVIDSEEHVEIANPAAQRMLGVLPKQPGQPESGAWLPPEPLRQPLTEALASQRDYFPDNFDKVIRLGPSGRERILLPRILTIRDRYGMTRGAAILLQDVTRLRLLDQVKSDLLATASHELKTPLTSIRLDIHLLLEERVGPLSPKQTELLLDARDNSERLLAMIDNLLDLARLEQGSKQLDLAPERPGELLRAAADAVRARADDQGIALVLDVPHDLPDIAADANRLGHALRNLLDNALTYTGRGGRVTLGARQNGASVKLFVADTGIGIPPDQLPHVFEKFFRVPGRTRGAGTGLGLAIVQEIVTAHAGTVSCESTLDAGTVFRLTLPVAAQSNRHPQEASV